MGKRIVLKCRGCSSTKCSIIPIGIGWRPDWVDNGDIEPLNWRRYLDRLPTLGQAIFDNAEDGVFYTECSLCGHCEELVDLTTVQIRAWARRNILPSFRRTWNKQLEGDRLGA